MRKTVSMRSADSHRVELQMHCRKYPPFLVDGKKEVDYGKVAGQADEYQQRHKKAFRRVG